MGEGREGGKIVCFFLPLTFPPSCHSSGRYDWKREKKGEERAK